MTKKPPTKRLMRIPVLAAAVGALGLALSGCSAATTPDMIAVVMGDGQTGNDANVHEVAYPGEKFSVGSDEEVRYFPGNSRNYRIENADGADRKELSTGKTKQGTPVSVSLTVFWQVNQDKTVLTDNFIPYCNKYNCATTDPETKDSEMGTASAGWAKMLQVDFGPSVDDTVRAVMPEFDDTVWQDQAGYDKVAARLSEEFNDKMRSRTGYSSDLFCGSGDVSGWADQSKPGEGKYKCGNVRFAITEVRATDSSQQTANNEASAAESQKESNRKVREAAEEKYGKDGGDWVGIQDTIEKCKEAGQNCTVVIGSNGVAVAPQQKQGDAK